MRIFVVYASIRWEDNDPSTWSVCSVKTVERAKKITEELNSYWNDLNDMGLPDDGTDDAKVEDIRNKLFHKKQAELGIKWCPVDFEPYCENCEFDFDRIELLPELDDKLDALLNEDNS